MMRKIGTMVLMVVAGLALAAPVQAQGFRGGGPGGGGGYMLLRNKGVQQELKLSDDQSEKVTKLVDEVATKSREKVQALPEDERREKGQEIFRAANEELKTAVKDVLKPEQVTRLEQIALQQRGLQAFADAKVQDKLSLSDDQKSKIRELGEESRTKMTELRGSFANDREGAMQKIAALRKESLEKAMGVLTDGQKKSWKELTGEPFEVRFEGRRPAAGN